MFDFDINLIPRGPVALNLLELGNGGHENRSCVRATHERNSNRVRSYGVVAMEETDGMFIRTDHPDDSSLGLLS